MATRPFAPVSPTDGREPGEAVTRRRLPVDAPSPTDQSRSSPGGSRWPEHSRGGCRDWSDFEWLIGHQGSALLRGPFARIRRLKQAQIADLLESASAEEESEILGRVAPIPNSRRMSSRNSTRTWPPGCSAHAPTTEIAEVLRQDARRRRRRRDRRAAAAAQAAGPRPAAARPEAEGADPDGLPRRQRRRADGGGLYRFPRPGHVRTRAGPGTRPPLLQPEALTSAHAVDADGGLRGVARLVTLVQADPDAALIDVSDANPVRVGADADITDVAVLMTDYNLITIPVVDDARRLLGVITVDDVLEIALPPDWPRREAAHRPGRAPHLTSLASQAYAYARQSCSGLSTGANW